MGTSLEMVLSEVLCTVMVVRWGLGRWVLAVSRRGGMGHDRVTEVEVWMWGVAA